MGDRVSQYGRPRFCTEENTRVYNDVKSQKVNPVNVLEYTEYIALWSTVT